MDAKAFSSTVARFAAKFCNELKKDTSVVSSPLSAEFVLGLLALGSDDPAHSELLTALGIPNDDAIRSSFKSLSTQLKSLKGVTLNIANRVYIKDGPYQLDSKLQDDATKVFDAGIVKINFGDGASAAKTINQWVESKTNNKIKDLLSSDSLSEDTRLVLVNALYFKGAWKAKFDPNHTMDQAFHLNADTTIQVPMMFKEADYRYGNSEELGAEILEMPYVGDNASMVIVLPNEIEGLNNVMAKLAAGYDLIADFDKMFQMKVAVSLPKFKIETELDLLDVLPKLGIKAIFDRSSSGLDKLLSPPEPLFVSKAVQKAVIEVNEEGAEAAAATAMGIMMTCAMVNFNPTKQFQVDRPFLVAIFVNSEAYFVATYRGPNNE